MFLSNVTNSQTGGVPFSVNFDTPADYLIFTFHLLFASTTVLVAGTVAAAIVSTNARRVQNRFIFMLNTSVCDTLVGLSVYYLGLFDVQEGYPSRNESYNALSYLGYQLSREPPSEERESNKESLWIVIFIVISFLVLWSPSFVNVILRLLLGKGLIFRNEATNPFATMARCNAVCTPSVYLWGSPALRKATMRTVWGRVCPRCKRRVSQSCSVNGKPTKSH